MVVVVGTLARSADEPPKPAGRACNIALAAARAGAAVQLVGRAGADPAADAVLLALSRGGVGHVAVLRDPATPTRVVHLEDGSESVVGLGDADRQQGDSTSQQSGLDAADVDLGLRYLTSFGVLVLAEDVNPSVVAVVAQGAAYAGAHLVLVVDREHPNLETLEGATILQPPHGSQGGAFEDVVGSYAAALDAGTSPDTAFRYALETLQISDGA